MNNSDREQVPDVGFSVQELQYLLSIAPGASADKSAEFMNVGPVPSVDDSILTGGAAILARGQLELLDGGTFAPVDSALVIAYILTNADRWTVIRGATEDSADLGLFIESPNGGLLAQPRTLGTWWFVILDPAALPGEVLIGTVMGMAHSAETSGVLAQTVTTGHDRTFAVRRTPEGWGYAYGAAGDGAPDRLEENVREDEVLIELASFIAYFPEMG